MEKVKKILVLGAAGMAGHVIVEKLKNHKIDTIARNSNSVEPTFSLDLHDTEKLDHILQNNYDYVINAVGILNQYAEENPDEAVFINSYLPHFLAKKGDKYGYKLIHISTDCVFSGNKGNYTETDVKDGLGFYAETKALGEVNYGKHLTIRTSIIGPELKSNGIGLFDWFMKQEGSVNGFTKAIWSGVTTMTLADAIKDIVEGNDISGLVHLTNNVAINKFDLLNIFKEVFEKDIIINKVDGKSIDKSFINTNEKYKFVVQSYKKMIVDMKGWNKYY